MWTPLLPVTEAKRNFYSHYVGLAKAAQRPGADKMDSVVQILDTALGFD